MDGNNKLKPIPQAEVDIMFVGKIEDHVEAALVMMEECCSKQLLSHVSRRDMKYLYELLMDSSSLLSLIKLSPICTYEAPGELCLFELVAIALCCRRYTFTSANVSWAGFDERFYVSLWRLIDMMNLRIGRAQPAWTRILDGRSSTGYAESLGITASSRQVFDPISQSQLNLMTPEDGAPKKVKGPKACTSFEMMILDQMASLS